MPTETTAMLYHNRELSWLKFNQRVLEQAADPSIPLLERLKFLSIFTNNLDEFFMIRVGSLTDRENHAPNELDNKSAMTPREQLDAVFDEVRALVVMKDKIADSLRQDLALCGITYLDMGALSQEQQEYLSRYYQNDIQPLLSPQIIDKHHPFPFLQNKSTYICVQLKTKGEFVKLGVIPLPAGISRILFLPFDNQKFVLLEDLIYHYCETIFQAYQVVDKAVFRITRNADITVDEGMYDQEMDYRSVMEEVVKNRRRLLPVRLELQYCDGGPMVDALRQKLELTPRRIFHNFSTMDMTFGFGVYDRLERQGRKDLFYGHLTPQQPAMLVPKRPIMDQIRAEDVLISYPFESITPFLQLLNEAATDENVVSIKMTLYRVARESRVISALIKAAETGKEVSVVVELRARFDEENNIVWSRRLEEAGVQVIYGLGEYKVHSKLLVITRKEGDKLEFFTQIGTGNYNESTSKLYTDLSLMTSDKAFGQEGLRIFNGILTDNPVEETTHLLAAPLTMKKKVLELISREIEFARDGKEACIHIKVNSVTDKVIIDRLIEASRAGVKIRMVVRGICCLRAGVQDYTDNIQVISIVGRFLEHSRIYSFGTPKRRVLYISSADFMTRNMERRVEVAAPIYDPVIQERLVGILESCFRDNIKAKRLLPDGTYRPVVNDYPACDSQLDLYKMAYMQAEKQAKAAVKKPIERASAQQQPSEIPTSESKDNTLKTSKEHYKDVNKTSLKRSVGTLPPKRQKTGFMDRIKGIIRHK